MKKTRALWAVILSACSAGSALAADLPILKAPPVVPPSPPTWTGFYFGANVGAVFDASPNVTTSAYPLYNDLADQSGLGFGPTYFGSAVAASTPLGGSLSNVGVLGGGQAGFNWQFGAFVAGVEADVQGSTLGSYKNLAGAALEPATQALLTTTTSLNKSLNYLGTVRGRLGYLVTPTLLAFGSGGLAYGGMNFSNAVFISSANPNFTPAALSAQFNDAKIGWAAGGGLEWMFRPDWSAKVEYLYYDLGAQTAAINFAAAPTNGAATLLYAAGYRSSVRFNGHAVRAGINYHWHWFAPAPVLAKY